MDRIILFVDLKVIDNIAKPTSKIIRNVFLFKTETYSKTRFFYEFGWNTLVCGRIKYQSQGLNEEKAIL